MYIGVAIAICKFEPYDAVDVHGPLAHQPASPQGQGPPDSNFSLLFVTSASVQHLYLTVLSIIVFLASGLSPALLSLFLLFQNCKLLDHCSTSHSCAHVLSGGGRLTVQRVFQVTKIVIVRARFLVPFPHPRRTGHRRLEAPVPA